MFIFTPRHEQLFRQRLKQVLIQLPSTICAQSFYLALMHRLHSSFRGAVGESRQRRPQDMENDLIVSAGFVQTYSV
jgi:hypothetical protein